MQHTPDVQAFPDGLGNVVEYVGEGMANVVFSFSAAADPVRGLLIRVPKEVTGDHESIHRHWCKYIYPLFEPADLVPQFLVSLDGQDALLETLRRELEAAESAGLRKSKMKGTKIKDGVRTAMLIQDMRPRNKDEVLVELKPKWLEQSPTAPADAVRCRNCAREALRNNQRGTSDPILCTLRLMDRSSDASMARARAFLTTQPGADSLHAGSPGGLALDAWLRANALLPRLRDAQVANDSTGVLRPADPFRLGLAMTLRDCTCYVRLPRHGSRGTHEVEARLGDLDLKDQTTKLDYWKNMELELHEKGYYLAKEDPHQETDCLLSDH